MESECMNRARALKIRGMRGKSGGERVLAALARGRRGLSIGNSKLDRTRQPDVTPYRAPEESGD